MRNLYDGKPLRGRGWGITYRDSEGKMQIDFFYTEEKNAEEALEKHLESLREEGYVNLYAREGYLA